MKEIIVATITRPQGETGVQTHINVFCNFLSERHIKYQLITPFSYAKAAVYPVFALRKLIDKVSKVCSVWWYRYWHAFFLQLVLHRQLAKVDECIIYAQCPVSAAVALKARRNQRQVVVLVVHFNVSQADEWAEKGYLKVGGALYQSMRAFEQATLSRLDGLVFVSAFMQHTLNQLIPAIQKLPSAVIPNFLADPGLPSRPVDTVADLISIGSLEARKNQQYALDILAALHNMGYPLTLSIVGAGPDKVMLENKVTQLKLDNAVHFYGFVANAAELLNSHRACLHTAKIENLPLTLLEALARGKPVFAVPVGGVPEVIGNDALVGVALPGDNAQAAAELVAKFLNDETWLAAATVAARQKFLQHYDREISANNLLKFLQQIKAQ